MTKTYERETSRDPQAGDYLVASWGYDQTNATFYKVLKRTPKMVTLVEVQSTKGEISNRLYPTIEQIIRHDWTKCKAGVSGYDGRHEDDDCYGPKVLRRKVQPNGSVRIERWGIIAHVYQGGGAYDTIAAGLPGH